MSSPDALVRDFLEQVWNERRADRFAEFVSPDVRFHPVRGDARDHAHYDAMRAAFVAAFPDLRFDIQRTVTEGDLVAVELIITGTNDGPFRGRPATGRRVRVAGRPWARVKDGQIVELWQIFDELGLLHQLGYFPDMGLLGAPFAATPA